MHGLEKNVSQVQVPISDQGRHEDGLKWVEKIFVTSSMNYISNKQLRNKL